MNSRKRLWTLVGALGLRVLTVKWGCSGGDLSLARSHSHGGQPLVLPPPGLRNQLWAREAERGRLGGGRRLQGNRGLSHEPGAEPGASSSRPSRGVAGWAPGPPDVFISFKIGKKTTSQCII